MQRPGHLQRILEMMAKVTKQFSNDYASFALGMGLVSVFTAFIYVTPIFAIVAGCFGIVRSNELKALGQPALGKKRSIAGLSLGGLYLAMVFIRNTFGLI